MTTCFKYFPIFRFVLASLSLSTAKASPISILERRKGGGGGRGGGGGGSRAAAGGAGASVSGLPFWAYLVIFFGTLFLICCVSALIYYCGKYQDRAYRRRYRRDIEKQRKEERKMRQTDTRQYYDSSVSRSNIFASCAGPKESQSSVGSNDSQTPLFKSTKEGGLTVFTVASPSSAITRSPSPCSYNFNLTDSRH